MTNRPAVRKAVILVSSVIAVSYLVYRGVWTLNLTTWYAVFASLFLYAGELYGVMNMLLFFLQVWDTTEPAQKPVLTGRTIDVFVPTYNEDPDLLRVTVQACLRMDYPNIKIYLCDDGKRPAVEALAKELGVHYMIRPDNRHAKAGNLNHAFAKTDGEFIIIFDADHVPDPNFITRLIGYFEDEKLAFVQTPHAFYNFDSFQARVNHDKGSYWEEGQLFYHVIQTGRNRWNASIFAGSAAMFRRKALEEVGYIAVETITEDMHTGLRMHSRGWKSLGISARMISGAAAQDVTTFHSQRLRWGEGNLSVLAHDNPLTMRGLSWGQRLCYFATMINWAGGLFKLPIYLTPLLMLWTGVPPVREFNWILGIMMVAYMVASILGTKYVSNGYGSVWYNELFTMASFWTQVRGTMRAMFWRKFQKFIVTKKRGRQSKSIWPFLRPQLALIALGLLALVWAWSRVIFGISDDHFKPMLASFWACFHALLAYLVVRRALWPEDRRFSTRHTVHLPITYALADASGASRQAVGVTADLNDGGVGFVAYERLPDGARMRLTLQCAGETITCEGTIKTVRELVRNGAEPAGAPTGFRYGVAFEALTIEQKDAVNRVCLHYAVPRLYAYYGQEHQTLDDAVRGQVFRLFFRRRAAPRRGFHLPLFLTPGDGGQVVPAVTEDVSANAVAVMLEAEIPVGTECPFTLTTPHGEARGVGRVLRNVPRLYSARPYYLCVLEFVGFEDGGRKVFDALFGAGTGKRLKKVLTPSKLPLRVPVSKPLAVGVAAAAVLILAELGMFRVVYRDDFFLQGIAASDRPVAAEDAVAIDRIYAETMREAYPSTDRLVLLGHTLQRMSRADELAEITKLLAPRDRNNLDLQTALAFAYDQREQYDQAEAEYQRLLAAVDSGALPASRREELMAGAARCSVHAGRLDLAAERYHDLLTHSPDRPEYRNEFAAVLLNAQRLREAADLYADRAPDHEGRVLLVMIHAQAKEWIAAEREARALVKENPGDETADGLLADILNLRGDYRQARSIYERLLKSNASDLKLAVQLAHTSLWAKNYQEALDRFQAIADQGALENAETLRKFPTLRRAYIGAAANAPDVGAGQRQTVLGIAERALAADESDAAFLAQLGWVLHRLDEFDQSSAVLSRALALDPNDTATRRQLAGVLVALGKADEALKLLEGRENSLDAHLMLADAYAANKDYSAAERECRDLLKQHPDNQEVRLHLADVLSWNKQYPPALEALEELVKIDPKNPVYAERLARVALWSGDHAGALRRYEALLTADFDRPALWWDFVDAAAGAKEMTAGQVRVAVAIADKTCAGDHKSSRAMEAFRKQGKAPAEAPYLTRLAWVLHQHVQDEARAAAVLDKAVALQPIDPAQRKELAGVLAAVGRYADALAMYDGLPLDWPDHLALARIHSGAGDFENAAKQCRLVLEKQPLDRDALGLLADVLSWDGRHAEALELLGPLVKTYPEDKDLRRRQAEVTLWSGDAGRALELFRSLLAEDFEQPPAWRGFMEAAGRADSLTAEQTELARRIAARPVADKPENVELMARIAWVQHRRLNDKEGARVLLLRAATLHSTNPAALTHLGWILYEVGNKADADGELKRAVALKPREAAVRRELAGVLTATQHFPEARSLLEGLVKDNPKDARLEADLAQAVLWGGDATAALDRLQSLLAAQFQQPELWRSYADAASAATTLTPKQLDLAVRIADQATPGTGKSEQAAFLSRLGWALYREGDASHTPALRDRAGALLDRAVALQPDDAKVREEIAGVLAAAGRPKQALPWLEEAARARPDDMALQIRLARVALANGDAAVALTRLQRLLDANIEQPILWVAYVDAASAAAKGAMTPAQIDLASRLAERPAPDAAPEKALYLSRLASALYREGKKEQAAPLLEKALASAPRDPKARRELAGALTAAGRFKEATASLEQLLRDNPGDAGIQGQLAQATLWGGDPALALTRLQQTLTANFDQTEFWSSYVDAASGMTKGTLTRDQVLLALRMAERPAPESAPDKALYLSRLAWMLHREGEAAKAAELLDKAVACDPRDPKVRRELAGVLTAVGKNEAGLRLYEGLTLDLDDRFQLVVLHAAARQFGEAEKQCRSILESKPDDKRAQQWLADVALWGNHFDVALMQYHRILTANFEQPALWPKYLEAASRLDVVSEDQARTAQRIIDREAADAGDAVYLARMALVLHRHVEEKAALPVLGARQVGLLASPLAPNAFLAATATAADRGQATRSKALLERAVAARRQDPTALARLAWVIYQMGDSVQATKVLDEAVAVHPPEPAVRREIGDVFVATGRLDAALPWFEELAGAYPKDPELQIRLAQVTVWAGAYEKGLERVAKLLDGDFHQPDLWPTYADAAAGVPSMTDKQIELTLRVADQAGPAKADARTLFFARLAWALCREGERTKTTTWQGKVDALLDRALKAAPADPKVRLELVGDLTAARRFAEALVMYEDLLRTFPDDRELRIRVAEVSLWSGAFGKAIARAEDLLLTDPKQPRLWRLYVDAASGATALTPSQAKLAQSIVDQRPGFTDANDEAAYLSRLAWVLVREGGPDSGVSSAKATALLNRAVAVQPTDVKVRRELVGVLAALHAADKDFDGAEKEARRLVELAPGDAEAQYLLANILTWNKKYDEAVRIYQSLLRDHPDDARIPVRLAEAAVWSGDYEGGLARFVKLLDKDWRQPALWTGLVDAAASVKTLPPDAHKELFLHIYDQVKDAPKQDAMFLSRLGWVLRRLEEPKKSVVLLKLALDQEPGSREIRTHLAEALNAAGDYAEAEKQFQILLRTSARQP